MQGLLGVHLLEVLAEQRQQITFLVLLVFLGLPQDKRVPMLELRYQHQLLYFYLVVLEEAMAVLIPALVLLAIMGIQLFLAALVLLVKMEKMDFSLHNR